MSIQHFKPISFHARDGDIDASGDLRVDVGATLCLFMEGNWRVATWETGRTERREITSNWQISVKGHGIDINDAIFDAFSRAEQAGMKTHLVKEALATVFLEAEEAISSGTIPEKWLLGSKAFPRLASDETRLLSYVPGGTPIAAITPGGVIIDAGLLPGNFDFEDLLPSPPRPCWEWVSLMWNGYQVEVARTETDGFFFGVFVDHGLLVRLPTALADSLGILDWHKTSPVGIDWDSDNDEEDDEHD